MTKPRCSGWRRTGRYNATHDDGARTNEAHPGRRGPPFRRAPETLRTGPRHPRGEAGDEQPLELDCDRTRVPTQVALPAPPRLRDSGAAYVLLPEPTAHASAGRSADLEWAAAAGPDRRRASRRTGFRGRSRFTDKHLVGRARPGRRVSGSGRAV